MCGGDSRDGCWSNSQKNKDPFLKAWIDDIPPTIPSRAVYEFNRKQNEFQPFKWDGYSLNPNVPSPLVNQMMGQIGATIVPHPKNKVNTVMLPLIFFFQMPIIFAYTIILTSSADSMTADQIQTLTNIYLVVILGTTLPILICSFCMWIKYKKNLKERETQLARLLDHITVTSLAAYRIKAVGGKCGAWVELQFEDPSTFMVMGAPGFGHYAPQGGAGIPNNANPFGYHQPPQFA